MGDMFEALAHFLLARIEERRLVVAEWPVALDAPPDGYSFWLDTRGHPIYEPRDIVLDECASSKAIVDSYLALHVYPERHAEDAQWYWLSLTLTCLAPSISTSPGLQVGMGLRLPLANPGSAVIGIGIPIHYCHSQRIQLRVN